MLAERFPSDAAAHVEVERRRVEEHVHRRGVWDVVRRRVIVHEERVLDGLFEPVP